MTRLSRSDLESVLDLAGEVAALARDAERQDEGLLACVGRLVGAELIEYARVEPDYRNDTVTVLGGVETPSTEERHELIDGDENPYRTFAIRTGQPYFRATRLFDLVELEAFRRTRLFQLIPLGDAPSAQMRMPGREGSWWQLEVLQPDGRITDRQLALLDAARPWLELYEDRRELARQVAAIRSAPQDQRGASRLSARERQVLDRLADGSSNQDIADALHISPGTVRKHLENIYAKLEVTSRTAALARTGRTSVPGYARGREAS